VPPSCLGYLRMPFLSLHRKVNLNPPVVLRNPGEDTLRGGFLATLGATFRKNSPLCKGLMNRSVRAGFGPQALVRIFLCFRKRKRPTPPSIIRKQRICPMVKGPRTKPSWGSGSRKNSTKNRNDP